MLIALLTLNPFLYTKTNKRVHENLNKTSKTDY